MAVDKAEKSTLESLPRAEERKSYFKPCKVVIQAEAKSKHHPGHLEGHIDCGEIKAAPWSAGMASAEITASSIGA